MPSAYKVHPRSQYIGRCVLQQIQFVGHRQKAPKCISSVRIFHIIGIKSIFLAAAVQNMYKETVLKPKRNILLN